MSNNPPDMTITAGEVMQQLSDWMAQNPAILEEAQAREAKLWMDRTKLCIADLEAERDGKVRPINEQVIQINDYYRGPREAIKRVLDHLTLRITAFAKAETERREAIAAEARRKAEEAKRLAREAEEQEKAKLEDASAGELDINVAEVISHADQAFADYKAAERRAAIADRDARVKIGGGIGRAIGLKEKETLVLNNVTDALGDIGITDNVIEAILKDARAFRRLHDRLPKGVSSTSEDRI